MNNLVLGVDLGGTNVRIAAVDRNGKLHSRRQGRTPRDGAAADIVKAVVDLCKEVLAEIDQRENIGAIGIAAPASAMDVAGGVVLRAPNLPMLAGFALRDTVGENIGLPAVLENDATSAAIGEHWLGASRSIDNSICVTLGTGVGGGIILNGLPMRGPDGTAGEIGHICVEPDGLPCGCGSQGCIEQYASATAVVRLARQLAAADGSSVLNQRNTLTSIHVYEAAKAGDKAAVRAFEQMGYYLGITLAGLINVLNPEAIVLAGGLAGAWDVFIDQTRDQIRKRAFPEPAERAKLVPAGLADDAGILGVARLAFTAADQGTLVS